MGVKESFDVAAANYDSNRRRLIPCYDDLYQLPLRYLRIEKGVYARMREDDPSRVDEQLKWLSSAGFPIVDCIYKYNDLAVFYAEKGK